VKQGQRHAIAHNLADSIASGCSLLLGVYDFSIGAHITESPSGRVVIECLQPLLIEGTLNSEIRELLAALPAGLTKLCDDEGGSPEDFSVLTLAFSKTQLAIEVEIVVAGPASIPRSRWFSGSPLRRKRVLDSAGRMRRLR
jgi:hypothetical protein